MAAAQTPTESSAPETSGTPSETSMSPSKSLSVTAPNPSPSLSTEQLLTVARAFRWTLNLDSKDRLNQISFSLHDLLIRDVMAWANEDLGALDQAILDSLFTLKSVKGSKQVTINEDAYRVACELIKQSPLINTDHQTLGVVMLRLIGGRVLWAYATQRWLETNPTPVATNL